MAPRFLERMQSQDSMQKKWNRRHPSWPPAYQIMQPSTNMNMNMSEPLPAYRSCPLPPAYSECLHDDSASSINLHSFPEGSTVLVIGAYTRQGMHIIDRLLDHQHSVRGIVANAREAAQTAKHFEASHGRERYQPCIISDPTARNAFDAAARNCSGVIFVTNRSSPAAGCGVETLAKVMSVLGSAMIEAHMNRFVYCYPAAASNDFCQGMTRSNNSVGRRERSIPENPPSYEMSRNGSERGRPETVPFSVELAIRDWIGVNQPGFALEIGKSQEMLRLICWSALLTYMVSHTSKQLRNRSRACPSLSDGLSAGCQVQRWFALECVQCLGFEQVGFVYTT